MFPLRDKHLAGRLAVDNLPRQAPGRPACIEANRDPVKVPPVHLGRDFGR